MYYIKNTELDKIKGRGYKDLKIAQRRATLLNNQYGYLKYEVILKP